MSPTCLCLAEVEAKPEIAEQATVRSYATLWKHFLCFTNLFLLRVYSHNNETLLHYVEVV